GLSLCKQKNVFIHCATIVRGAIAGCGAQKILQGKTQAMESRSCVAIAGSAVENRLQLACSIHCQGTANSGRQVADSVDQVIAAEAMINSDYRQMVEKHFELSGNNPALLNCQGVRRIDCRKNNLFQ